VYAGQAQHGGAGALMGDVAHAERVALAGRAVIPIPNRVAAVGVAEGTLFGIFKTPGESRVGGLQFNRTGS